MAANALSFTDTEVCIPTVVAVQHLRRMRGGAQAQLMRCSDDKLYVVKFRNNPQHLRVLANEMFATLLGTYVGLPLPAVAIVDVSEWLISHTPELNINLASQTIPCVSGLQYGARFVIDPPEGNVFDHFSAPILERLRNLETFAGILALDKWTCNTDGRQATFWRAPRQQKYTATFIDQGFCFNAGDWTFPDFPLRGVFPENAVYDHIRDWASFEPWLPRMESMSERFVRAVAGVIPPAWYDDDWHSLEVLTEQLLERRLKIKSLINDFRLSARKPFTNWSGN